MASGTGGGFSATAAFLFYCAEPGRFFVIDRMNKA
jgi:hypothetical protein